MLDLPTDLPRKYRYALNLNSRFGKWNYSYELVGSKGALNLRISGPHVYDGAEHWNAGLETHSRTPMNGDTAPDHAECWLLKCPCWHDGTSLYAQEEYLPMVLRDDHDGVFRQMVRDADRRWSMQCEEVA